MEFTLQAVSARHPAAPGSVPAVLRDIGLRVGAGEQVGIIGPSGSGKTTLLHVLACALRPSAGSVQLGGTDPWSLPGRDLRRLRGSLFLAPQLPPLPPRQRVVTALTAGRLPHMGLWRSLRELVRPSQLDAAEAALAHFDLADKLFSRVDRLSGGERQRVGLARALMTDARLLLVDEPLSALDPSRSLQAMQSLVDVARARGATLVATMHDVPIALRCLPRIVGLRAGEVMFDLPSAQVTPALLESLYAQHLDELEGPALPMVEITPEERTPFVVVCR